MKTTFVSKISYTFVVIIFVVFFTPLLLNLVVDGFTRPLSLVFVGVVVLYAFFLYTILNIKYIVSKKELLIKAGCFKIKTIVLEDIKSIKKSTNFSSAPAASFDRLEIAFGKFEEIIISPKQQILFAKTLVSYNSKIVSFL